MNKRVVTAIVISLVFTVLAIGGIVFGLKQITKPEETIKIAVAVEEIKAGTILQTSMYDYVSIPKSQYIPSYVTYEEIIKEENGSKQVLLNDTLKGKETKTDIYKGERIAKGRVSGVAIDTIEDSEGNVLDVNSFRRMSFSASGTKNLSGQMKSGDKVDFWLRYKLTDKNNNDQIVVVDKILKDVPVLKAFDSNGVEITTTGISASSVELLLTEEEVQEYLKWADLGNITLVKVPVGSSDSEDNEIVRKKLSMNDLIHEIISQEKSEVTANEIKKDPTKKEQIEDYIIEENTVE